MDQYEFDYDAFISYRHVSRDMDIAKKLHSALETYRTPKNLVRKGFHSRINRVFRDKEELPTSCDLSSDIEDALKKSRFLIVICSPEAIASTWVLKEVEIFASFNGYDKIITLLVEGEPKDSFPPGIIRYLYNDVGGIEKVIEPLAADIRARDGRTSSKLLKEEKLRLIATILGCKFDDLKQREHERKIRKIITLSIAIGSTFALFALIFLIQLYQVTAAKNLAQKNRSSLLTYVASSQTSNGDRMKGMLLALEAYQSNDVKNNAFNVKVALYSSAMARNFQYRTIIKSKDKIIKGTMMSNDDYMLVKTGVGDINIYNTKNGELVETFRPNEYFSNWFTDEIYYVCDVIPYTDNIIIRFKDYKTDKSKYVLYDVIDKKEIRILYEDHNNKESLLFYELDWKEQQTALPIFCYSIFDSSDDSASKNEVYIIDSKSGKQINVIDIPVGSYCIIVDENTIAVTSEGTLIVYNVYSGTPIYDKNFGDETIQNIEAFNGKYLSVYTDAKKLVVLDILSKKSIISLSISGYYKTAVNLKNEKVAIIASDENEYMKLAIYNLDNGIRESETETIFTYCTSMFFSPDNSRIIIGGESAYYSIINIFSVDDGINILSKRVIPIVSLNITKNGDRLIAVYKNNDIGIIEMTANEIINTKLNIGREQKISPDRTILIGSSGFDICIIDVNSGTIVKTLQGHTDYINYMDFSQDGKKIISTSYDGTVRIWDVATCENSLIIDIDTIVYSAKISFDNKFLVMVSQESLSVWDANTGLMIRQLEDKVDESTIDLEDLNHDDDYAEFNPDGTRIISKRGNVVKLWDSTNGNVLFENKDDIITNTNISQVMFSPNGLEFLICKPFQIDIYGSDNYIADIFCNFDEIYDAGTLVFSPDGKRIAFSTAASTTYVWGIEHSEYVSTKLLSTIYGDGHYSASSFLSDSNRIFVMNNNGLILYDVDKNAVLCLTGCMYNFDVIMQPNVYVLNDKKVLAIEGFSRICNLKEWPIFNEIEELASFVKSQVGNRKIDADFYSELSENSYE